MAPSMLPVAGAGLGDGEGVVEAGAGVAGAGGELQGESGCAWSGPAGSLGLAGGSKGGLLPGALMGVQGAGAMAGDGDGLGTGDGL
jgi:hypothetical protein